jgi:DNA polymerase IV
MSEQAVSEQSEKELTILHIDMDAFYASVAERDDPTLKGKAVVVGMGARGVVSSANYAARKLGVRSAMPLGQARRLAPRAVFVPVNMERNAEVSSHIMEIFQAFTPLVEPISLDEAFLDVTGSKRLHGSGRDIGRKIRARIESEEGITCSVGIAGSKFIAKLASTYAKPNGMLEIHSDRILEFLHPLPVSAMWGVGPKTNEELQKIGLRTIGDIAKTPRATLIRALGQSAGETLYELSWGRDYRSVTLDEPDKSIGAEETFLIDLDNHDEILKELLRMVEKSSQRLRDAGLVSKTISIKIRFADFTTISRSKTVPLPISGVQECYEVARSLYKALGLDRARIRLVGVSLENLSEGSGSPQQLFLGEREKGWREATAAMDAATRRFGRGSVRPARLVTPGEPADANEDEESAE